MSTSRITANGPAWFLVRERLAELDLVLSPEGLDSLAVAKAFDKVASSLHFAVLESGASSMRFAAVVKALDLKTPKSKLQTFLAERGVDE